MTEGDTTITVVEKEGSKLIQPRESSSGSISKYVNAPLQAGDCGEPNNYIPIDDSNAFFCPFSIVLGSTVQQNAPVLPDKVTLSITAGRDRCVYDLQVAFTNQQKDDGVASAALLTVPRLADVLLLEESHTCGDVSYKTRVEESAEAVAQYEAAAASSTQTATLSETAEQVHHVQMDKVPAGEQATFRLRFLQVGGLKHRQAVLDPSHHSANVERFIADLAVVPGFVGLDAPTGVPFELRVRLESGLRVELPEEEVMYHDASAELVKPLGFGVRATTKSPIRSIVQLGPSLVEGTTPGKKNDLSWLSWKSITGLARGTLLKVRLVDEHQETTTKLAAANRPIQDMNDTIASVDTMEGICHDPGTGACRDSSMVDIHVPLRLPSRSEFLGGTKQHQVYVIVDTSGSTSMRKNTEKSFLDTCKVIMERIFRALPAQIKALSDGGALSGGPVTFHLWSFDSDARAEVQNYRLGAGGNTTLEPLQFKIQGLRSSGGTNYDEWAKELEKCVSNSATDLHSILVVTDGGATHRAQFMRSIESCMSTAAAASGFFQVDCLGYGPWLDPTCVTQLANTTWGEALMVESLEEAAGSTQDWVTGILARSLLRASARLTLKISGGDLLAVTNIGANKQQRPPSSKYNSSPFSPLPWTAVSVTAGQKIRMVLLHDSGSVPSLSLECEGAPEITLPWTGTHLGNSPVQSTTTAGESSSWPNKKLSDPATAQTLRHLALLEPAFGAGAVGYPNFTADKRKTVTLAASIRGQIVAPSVTKGIAVASLSDTVEPVPEHCRPKTSPNLWSVGDGEQHPKAPTVRFQDDGHTTAFTGSAGSPFGAAKFGSTGGAMFSFGALAPAPTGFKFSGQTPPLFGAPAPASGGFRGFRDSAIRGSPSASAAPSPNPFGSVPAPSPPSLFGSGCPGSPSPRKKGPPAMTAWIRETRGGLFPSEQNRMHKQSTATRLTRSSLATKIQDVLQCKNPLAGVVPASDDNRQSLGCVSSLPDLDPKLALHLIECAVRLFPGSAGSTGAFEEWVESNELAVASDAKPLLQGLRFAAGLCGIQEATNSFDVLAWPWAGGVQGHGVGAVTPQEVAARKSEQHMFSPAVRRDIYRVLRSPRNPRDGASAPPKRGVASVVFPESALLAKMSKKEKEWDVFVFCDRADAKDIEKRHGYTALDDGTMLDAVSNIGNGDNPTAIAVTVAFEAYLEELVRKHWGDREASCLSIEFLVAFGREMTPRLDLGHRIRSTRLTAEELALVVSPRLAAFVDKQMLRVFQGEFQPPRSE